MVHFNPAKRQFTVTFSGTAEDYLDKLRAVMRLLAISNPELLDHDTKYHAATLIDEMLPQPEQGVTIVTK